MAGAREAERWTARRTPAPPGHQPDARPPGHQLQDPLWRRGRGDGVGRDHSRRDSSLRRALRILGHVGSSRHSCEGCRARGVTARSQGLRLVILCKSHCRGPPTTVPGAMLLLGGRGRVSNHSAMTEITRQPLAPNLWGRPAGSPRPGLQKSPSHTQGQPESLFHKYWPGATPGQHTWTRLTLPSSLNAHPASFPGELVTRDSVGQEWRGGESGLGTCIFKKHSVLDAKGPETTP